MLRQVTTAILLLLGQPLAAATECSEYADKLERCASYECSFKHPFSGKLMSKGIIGLEPEGGCLTREQMPGKMQMECRFDPDYRKEVAAFIRQADATREISAKARISGDKSSVETRLDGKRVKNPLQLAMERGYCQVIMPTAGSAPKAAPRATDSPKKQYSPSHRSARSPQADQQPLKQQQRDALPDLAVVGLTLDSRCRPLVTLEARGGQGVPASAYDRMKGVGIQLYKGGKGWQGVALSAVDRRRTLMKPAAILQFPLFQSLPPETPVRVKVVADHRLQLKEITRENNTLEVELNCTSID